MHRYFGSQPQSILPKYNAGNPDRLFRELRQERVKIVGDVQLSNTVHLPGSWIPNEIESSLRKRLRIEAGKCAYVGHILP